MAIGIHSFDYGYLTDGCIHSMMGLLAIYNCSQAYLSIYYTGLIAKLFIFQSPLSSHLTTRLSSSALKKLLISFK